MRKAPPREKKTLQNYRESVTKKSVECESEESEYDLDSVPSPKKSNKKPIKQSTEITKEKPTMSNQQEPVEVIYSTEELPCSFTHQHVEPCFHGVTNPCFNLDRITSEVTLTRKSKSSDEHHEVFRETDLPSFKKAMDLVLEIVSNLDDSDANLLCTNKFLDFGAGNFLLCSYVACTYKFHEVCGIYCLTDCLDFGKYL